MPPELPAAQSGSVADLPSSLRRLSDTGLSSRCSIDCAGILKLRNADIELRKGETDIGRKNTRVRLVFRVHIPEASGRIVSLQTASNPIECCKSGCRLGSACAQRPRVGFHTEQGKGLGVPGKCVQGPRGRVGPRVSLRRDLC